MRRKYWVWGIICLSLLLLFPVKSKAEEQVNAQENVRIGYYTADRFQEGGSDSEYKTGYGYEYIQKVADYTGWRYEYVYGTWSELFEQLINGDIDLMAGIAYSENRAERISYPNHEMLNETFYIYKDVDDRTIEAGDMASYTGKRIGVLSDNQKMINALMTWQQQTHAKIGVKKYNDLTACAQAFKDKEIDAFVSADNIVSSYSGIVPTEKIGKEPYYLCVSKKRPELLDELNHALSVIDEQDALDLDALRNKYSAESTVSVFLSTQEREWMQAHPSVTVGYVDHYLPYCDTDQNGTAVGLIADIVPDLFAALPETYEPEIIYRHFDSQREMLDELKTGNLDFIFPVSDNRWYSEQEGYQQSSAIIASPVALAYKEPYSTSLTDRIAVNEKNLLQYSYTRVNYPDAEIVFCDSSEACIQLVASGEADSTLVISLRGDYLLSHQKKMNMLTLSKNDQICFGVAYGNSALLQLLNHGLTILGDGYGMTHSYPYINKMAHYTFTDLVKDNILLCSLIVLILVFIVVIYFMQREQNQRQIAKKEWQQNQKLEEALQVARKAETARQIFLRNMSHDIRTPMNAVIGFTNLAIQADEEKGEKVQDYLQKILSSSQHLLGIVNEVLEISRIESGHTPLDEKPHSIADIVNEVDIIIRGQAQEKHQSFDIDISDIKDHYIFCDKLRMKEILVNLLGNSVKFTPDGGQITLKMIQMPCQEEGYGIYETHVKDNGCGMSPEFIDKIFVPFERELNSTVSIVQGTGLGMPIVKGFIDMMGGTIQIFSQENKGTEMIVHLKHRLAKPEEIASESEIHVLNQAQRQRFSGKRLLLAEDNVLNQEIAVAILEEAGFIVDLAENGAVAVEKVKAMPGDYYAAVLMDIQMPVMDGYTATQQIRSMADKAVASVPIIAISANAFEEDKQLSEAVGMDGHLAKPIHVEELMMILQGIL